jgi:biotin carboxyl carrier protein
MTTKFRLLVDGVPYDIERKAEVVVVNGLEYTWSVNGKALSVGGNTHTVEVNGTHALVDGITYTIETQGLDDPQPRKTRTLTPPSAGDDTAITAIMPGLIIEVNKHQGDHVEAGDVVVVLEAMKMQNELQAKRSGTLKQVTVRKGDTVEMRQVLAIIE